MDYKKKYEGIRDLLMFFGVGFIIYLGIQVLAFVYQFLMNLV